MSARQRARQAKAAFDRERVEREKKIENLVMSYYVADDAEQAAQKALETATRDRAQTVGELEALGLKTKNIALLCGVEEADVRALRRALKRVESDDAPSGVPDHSGGGLKLSLTNVRSTREEEVKRDGSSDTTRIATRSQGSSNDLAVPGEGLAGALPPW